VYTLLGVAERLYAQDVQVVQAVAMSLVDTHACSVVHTCGCRRTSAEIVCMHAYTGYTQHSQLQCVCSDTSGALDCIHMFVSALASRSLFYVLVFAVHQMVMRYRSADAITLQALGAAVSVHIIVDERHPTHQ
jgi:hypothetical protein